ncbi:MAG TPA: hypothetical protein DCY80_21400, partial [Solibacterales bacterium]|nr:hypothetical protein [Bryobacterales bacterium]
SIAVSRAAASGDNFGRAFGSTGNPGCPSRIACKPARAARLNGASPDAAARDLATQLDIAALLHEPARELSVGQQQRVAAARALMGNPELVIADEPTSALDHDHRAQFLETLFQCCQRAGSTLLFVSHDRSLEPMFDRALSLPELQRRPA